MFSLISIPRSLILLIANKTKTRPIDRALKQVGDVEDGPLKGHCNGISLYNMMTSSIGNIFHVTGALLGESTGHRWIPLMKARDAELWCLLWSVQTVEQTIETPVIRGPSRSLWRHCNEIRCNVRVSTEYCRVMSQWWQSDMIEILRPDIKEMTLWPGWMDTLEVNCEIYFLQPFYH